MKNSAANPLLTVFDTPFQTVPFDKIKPEHFEPAFTYKIKEAQKRFKSIVRLKEKPSFENTLLPFELQSDELSRMGLILFNLNSAETSTEIQHATQKISPMLTRFLGKAMLDKKFFKRVETVYKLCGSQISDPEQCRLAEITYKTMKRNGAGLNFFQKRKLINIQMKLSRVTLVFNEHLLSETNKFRFHITNKDDLLGLPETVIETAAFEAKKEELDGWVFTLFLPSYFPFMKFADSRELRKNFYIAYSSRGNQGNKNDNNWLVRKIVNLRLKQAKILGYNNFAEYVLEERMASSPEKVQSFINELHQKAKPFAEKEIEELTRFAHSLGHEGDLQAWDISYYSEKLRKQCFGFNEETIKPYFQLEKAINGVFNLATRLYGISFSEVKNISVYHPDVKTYEVIDNDGSLLAILYADFFPRNGKNGGAWMTEFLSQSNVNGKPVRPHISMCCNFSKPIPGKPSLLTINELNTLLHEFGHALHGILANTKYPSLSGTNVYRDFVELPSQIMENWVLEIDWLNQFAVHYETGEPMPKELIDKLIDSRNFQTGLQTERQVSFAMNDMAWHTLTSKFSGDVISFERKSTEQTTHFPYVTGTCVSTSFSHIFSSGYAAGYYSYKWAEVLDADAFSVFSTTGIFNAETATRFRKEILEKGGTAHPMELYKNFRGQEPSIEPLLIRCGLK